jgi:hypothetical protein
VKLVETKFNFLKTDVTSTTIVLIYITYILHVDVDQHLGDRLYIDTDGMHIVHGDDASCHGINSCSVKFRGQYFTMISVGLSIYAVKLLAFLPIVIHALLFGTSF